MVQNLPSGWKWVKVSEVADTKSGGTPSRSHPEFFDGDIPWIKSGELKDSYIRAADEYISDLGLKNSSANVFSKGTVVVALYGATAGKVGLLDIDTATNQAVCAIIPKRESFIPKYMFYWIISQRDNLLNQRIGGAQPNISQGIIRSQRFPLTSIENQISIVEKIEELFSELDAGVTGLKRAQSALKHYRASVLKNAVEGNLFKEQQSTTGIPEGWQSTTIKRIATKDKNSIKRGPFGSSVKKAYFVTEGYKIYQQRNVIDNDFSYGDYYIDSERFAKLKDFEIFPGDILITGAGTIGKFAVVPENIQPGIMNQALLKISLNPELIITDFFFYFFEVKAREYLLAKTRGSAMKNISSVRDLKEMEILLPPINEQMKIVEEVERQLTIIDEIKLSIEKAHNFSSKIRHSILKQAFQGNLV